MLTFQSHIHGSLLWHEMDMIIWDKGSHQCYIRYVPFTSDLSFNVMRNDYVGISVSYTELFTVTWNTFDHVDISESYPRQFTVG